jgi:small subunit ribosomal protein S17
MKTKADTKTNQPAGEVKNPKILRGVVVSTKNDKTAVVSVARFVKHPKYQKFFKKDKKYQVHDENNSAALGDKVEIVETRPISKTKRFVIKK